MRKYNSVITIAAILFCWAAVNVKTPAQHESHGGQKPAAQGNQRQETPCQRPRMEMFISPPCHLIACLQNMITYARLLRDQIQQNNCVDGEFARYLTAEIRRGFDQVDRYYQEQMNMAQGGMRVGAMMDHSSMRANEPSEFRALREIGADRGSLTPPAPTVQCKTPAQAGAQSSDHTHSQTGAQADSRMAGQMAGQAMDMEMMRMEACLTQLSAHLVELERETGAANPNPKWVLEHTNAILRILDEMSTMRGGGQAAR